MDRRVVLGLLAGTIGAIPPLVAQARADEIPKGGHRLAIQIDTDDMALMNLALANARNALTLYTERGEKLAVEIVTFGPGLTMLRADTSPVKDRITALRKSLPGAVFSACNNTKTALEKTEGKAIALVPEATIVPAGIVRLMELQDGWSYIRT